MTMATERIVNGSFGELWENGAWKDNINQVTAEVNIQKTAIKRSGTRWDGHKVIGVNGTGTASGFKVTSSMIAGAAWLTSDAAAPTSTEFISYLKDPEAYGFEGVKLKGVKFDKIQVANWQAGQEVKEDTPFTFEGIQLINEIKATV